MHALFGIDRETQQLEARMEKLKRASPAPRQAALTAEDARRMQEELKFAEGVAEQLTMPWEALFRALEAAAMRDVALLSLEPEAKRRTLRITAEAKSKDAMLKYFRRLSDNSMLLDVHLVEHQVRPDPGQPVRFSVKASWAGRPHG